MRACPSSVGAVYAYSAYGETAVLGPDGGNALRYTGREDDGNGLYYYRARYYDPVLKRFVTEDPIGIEAGLNLYAFVDGDPVLLVDPTGEWGVVGGAYGAISGGVSGYISSGGNWKGAALGASAGFLVGLVNPWSSTVVGGAAGGVVSSAVGQIGGNTIACRNPWDIDWNLAVVSGLGSGAGQAAGRYLSISNRSASSFIINRALGPTPQPLVQSSIGVIKGTTSGFAQYGYKGAFYPRGYPPNNCGCP